MRFWPLLAGVPVAASFAWLRLRRGSAVVSAWHPSSIERIDAPPLAARASGSGDTTVLLLHGLGGTGDYWPGDFDALTSHARVVIPDLLGFGNSMDGNRTRFGIDDHLDSITRCLSVHAPETRRLVIVGHSMGGAVAVALAAQTPSTEAVILAGSPIYENRNAALRSLRRLDPLPRFMLFHPRFARWTSGLNDRFRTAAAALAPIVDPRIPAPILRQGTLYTWPVYEQAIDQLILNFDWDQFRHDLDPEISLHLLWGDSDVVGDREYARQVFERAEFEVFGDANHHLPITHAEEILTRISPYTSSLLNSHRAS